MIKAMVFAAGLGTRMRPITDTIPKALVPVDGVPLLEIVIRRLIQFGICDIIVNVHYMADQIEDFLAKNEYFGVNIVVSDERDLVLETGGGLRKASWFFDDGKPFLVCNTDVLSDINLHKLYQQHVDSQAIATLAIQNRKTSRYFLFDSKQRLSGWLNTKSGEVKMCRLESTELQMMAFSTFQILDQRIFDYFPKNKNVFSTIEVFLAAAQNEIIMGYEHSDDAWIDVGTPANIEPATAIAKLLRTL